MNEKFRSVLVAGTHSSVGKTTWSLALMALARRKGLQVQPFKAGPDYIDPSFHHVICSPRKSRNLDLFLLSKEKVRSLYKRHCQDAGLAIVEGVMGLYDGKGAAGTEGSSAELAKILRLPVFLVIDGSGMAGGSAAALVLGFQKFDPELNLAGILINRVSQGHYNLLKPAIESATGLKCLGFLPNEKDFAIPERHLGLVTAGEAQNWKQKIDRAVSFLEKSFDWESFLRVSSTMRPSRSGNPDATACLPARLKAGLPNRQGSLGLRKTQPFEMTENAHDKIKIGVARDEAFSFYYEDNLDLLRDKGAEIFFFSPLKDSSLPQGLDLLYFGGGFPEIYASQLAENGSMIKSVRDFHAAGGFIYGECGGLIYLTEAFRSKEGREFPLAGLLPGKISMTDRLQHFGYHKVKTQSDTFLFPKDTELRSHEFHYSIWNSEGKVPAAYQIGERPEGIAAGRLFASYQHLHFGSEHGLLDRLFQNLEQSKKAVEARVL